MPTHFTSTKGEELLRIQRNRQLLGSVVLGIASVTMAMAVLSLFLELLDSREPTGLITVVLETEATGKESSKKSEPRKIIPKNLSAPANRIKPAIPSMTRMEVALPVLELHDEIPSIDMSLSEDFGDTSARWYRRGKVNRPEKGGGVAKVLNQEGSGNGEEGSAEGSVTFFDNTTPARRVAYVIDFSKSMRKGQREALMRHELARSVGALDEDMEYQMIFFCGFSWVAGGRVEESKWRGKRAVTITHSNGLEFELIEETQYTNRFELRDKSKAHKPQWLKASEIQRERSLAHIEGTPIVPQWGTNWEPAFEMALRMHPKPDAIVFMTDGVYCGNPQRVGEKLGNQAKSQGIVIHAVSLMEPRAKDALLRMAELTGGAYTEIGRDGLPVQSQPEQAEPATPTQAQRR